MCITPAKWYTLFYVGGAHLTYVEQGYICGYVQFSNVNMDSILGVYFSIDKPLVICYNRDINIRKDTEMNSEEEFAQELQEQVDYDNLEDNERRDNE